jgi:hypothetical protein
MNLFNLVTSGMQAASSIPGGLLSAKQLTSREPKGPAPGAERAYTAFISAAMSVLYRYSLMASLGVPPPLRGGMWTFPIVYRSHRVLADQNEAMLVAYGQIAALGSTDAFKAADEVVRAINEVALRWPKDVRWVERDEQTVAAMRAAGDRLADFSRHVHSEVTPAD